MQQQKPSFRVAELVGFLLILAGMAVFPLTGEIKGAGTLIGIGFLVFLIGRFQK